MLIQFNQQILLLLERALGYMPESFRILIKRQEYRDFIEVWLGLEDRLFSDEIKEMERIIQHLNTDLTQELGVPVSIRLREKRSLEAYAGSAIEDLR